MGGALVAKHIIKEEQSKTLLAIHLTRLILFICYVYYKLGRPLQLYLWVCHKNNKAFEKQINLIVHSF